MKKRFCVLLFLFIPLFFYSENLSGIWENGSKIIEFAAQENADSAQPLNDENRSFNMRMVLKPYYAFVFEPLKTVSATVKNRFDISELYYLGIEYPRERHRVQIPVCIFQDALFTSFFQRMPYYTHREEIPEEAIPVGITAEQEAEIRGEHKSLLFGFWVEEGTPDGILLYPNEIPQHITAYFFTEKGYIAFRYWKDDLEYRQSSSSFTADDEQVYEIPQYLQRGEAVYTCTTGRGRQLRNYQQGTYTITGDKTQGLTLSLKPEKAGPGTHAVWNLYPNSKYPEITDLPLYITETGQIFSYGAPFLMRSKITDLDSEVTKHNALRRPSREPLLLPDKVDFFDSEHN
ncbi:hypothetical protein FUT79_08065 [Treponema phagedenis]|uniref:hypothetical protein n=1 Tax=Treponema phagedenis TaxID=162 RepID=UPI0011E622E6|nr:hypothetical protein [Treponema phagedenis]QEJ95157.1 hypothetical protein FUT79_08065 [Treponema phagedenis]